MGVYRPTCSVVGQGLDTSYQYCKPTKMSKMSTWPIENVKPLISEVKGPSGGNPTSLQHT